MAGKHVVGSVRPSQLLWTYGPGALVDLPNLSAVTKGLDHWDTARCRPVEEARLLAAVRKALGPQALSASDRGGRERRSLFCRSESGSARAFLSSLVALRAMPDARTGRFGALHGQDESLSSGNVALYPHELRKGEELSGGSRTFHAGVPTGTFGRLSLALVRSRRIVRLQRDVEVRRTRSVVADRESLGDLYLRCQEVHGESVRKGRGGKLARMSRKTPAPESLRRNL